MCVPSAAVTGVSSAFQMFDSATSAISAVSDFKTNRENYAYRTQIALNNAKEAQNEAMRQTQLGIEKSRLEKIQGLREVSKLQAQNSASGLDMASQTSSLAYQDAMDLSSQSANTIKKEYDTKAKSYFSQASSYFSEAQTYQNQYNKSLFDYSLNALGKMSTVASNWYNNDKS